MNYIVEEIQLHTLSDELMNQFLDFQEITHQIYYSDDVLNSREFRKRENRVPPAKNTTRIDLIIRDEIKILGWAIFFYHTLEMDQNPEYCEYSITVHPNYCNQKIGKTLLIKLLELSQSHKKTKYEIWLRPHVNNGAAKLWMDKLPIKHVTTEKKNRLYKTAIRQNYIQSKLEHLNPIMAKYDLKLFEKTKYNSLILENDEFANSMVDFYNEVDNLVPREESERKDSIITVPDLRERARTSLKYDWNSLFYFAFDDKCPIAVSMVFFPNDEPVQQFNTGLTAVRKKYHRQGIATYLKILIIQYIVDTYDTFKYLDTENAGSNIGMLSINKNLGFKEVYQWFSYEGKVEELQNYYHIKNT